MPPAETLRLVAASSVFLAALAIAAAPILAAAVPARRPAHHVTAADREIYSRLLAAVRVVPADRRGARLVAAGLALEGTPYVAGALEVPGAERLVCNLRGLDCVTFVEACLAAARVADLPDPPFEAFLAELARNRYRDGRIDGYASRLHYFSEWIARNAARGALRDVTADLGGVPADRQIDYMSAHRKLYPRLASERTFAAIQATERELSARSLVLVPRDRVAAIEADLQDGDILAIVPTTAGLDVSHTGLVRRGADGRPRLLHAPDVGDRVRTTTDTVAEYVAGHAKVHGLIVARPL
ncbi:MAG: DUF1460 domain-containing protein [Candidatus Sericytochromatia bacterium]|nr:DUF1460 domain-containing protein [Candidatus Tanganyikabacteria bacterium]